MRDRNVPYVMVRQYLPLSVLGKTNTPSVRFEMPCKAMLLQLHLNSLST